MADSLDALLDEVEAKFCREISVSRAPSCTVKAEQDNHRQRSKDFVHRDKSTNSGRLGQYWELPGVLGFGSRAKHATQTFNHHAEHLTSPPQPSTFRRRIPQLLCDKECYGKSFLPVRLYNNSALCQERDLFSGITINSISDTYKVEGVDDIEAVLQEILDDDYPASSSHRPVLSKTCSVESCSQTALKTCSPVCLGGSAIARGVGTSVTQKVCDRLRCTSCDFRVVMFDDQEWDSSCDYLFFRNNMPDCNKLQVKLKRRRGARAYACQCSWHSAVILSELGHVPNLKWVCGKHTAC